MPSILRETARIVLRILKHFAIVFDITLCRISGGALLARFFGVVTAGPGWGGGLIYELSLWGPGTARCQSARVIKFRFVKLVTSSKRHFALPRFGCAGGGCFGVRLGYDSVKSHCLARR